MDWKSKTIGTYDESATALAVYFGGIGARTEDIERGLDLAQAGHEARVVEIGCGDGRDAKEIISRVAWYEGYDPSRGLLSIAQDRLTNGSFILADALSYNYPKDLDVIYAFASLLHVPIDDMPVALAAAIDGLRDGGILLLSLKERPDYTEEAKIDDYGQRMFYYYTPALIKELASKHCKAVYEDHQTIGKTDWFTLALQKK